MLEEHQQQPVVLLGASGCGKDFIAEHWWNKYGITYGGSSWEACKLGVRDQLAGMYGLKYESDLACFNDRHNHRDEWFRLIALRAHYEPLWLASRIFAKSNVYVGLRSRAEYEAIAKAFNPIFVWVHAGLRVPLEAHVSNQLLPDDADHVLPNDRSKEEGLNYADELAVTLFPNHVKRWYLLHKETEEREKWERAAEDCATIVDRLRQE